MSETIELPEYISSLVQLPEKFWPGQRWGARSLTGQQTWGKTAGEALTLLNERMKEQNKDR